MSIGLAGANSGKPAHERSEITRYRSVLGQLLVVGDSSLGQTCALVWSPGCSETEQSDALRCQNAEHKLVEQAKSTAEMGIDIPCGVVNLETCSVACYAGRWFRER